MPSTSPGSSDDQVTPEAAAEPGIGDVSESRESAVSPESLESPESANLPAQPRRSAGQVIWAGIREVFIVLGLALLLSFIVKTWLLQAFYIPSASMEDTLVKDDRVIVSKLTPGPFDLHRGDVIVFEDPGAPEPWLPVAEPKQLGPVAKLLTFVGLLPEDSENHLIKRVIGLPGDHIVADGSTGKLKVNDVEVTEPYLKPGAAPSEGRAFDIVVPAGSVWVMGDNRDHSGDSRVHDDGTGATGSVPMSKIVGRALFIVWPLDHVGWLGVPDTTFGGVPAGATTPPALPAGSVPTVPGPTLEPEPGLEPTDAPGGSR